MLTLVELRLRCADLVCAGLCFLAVLDFVFGCDAFVWAAGIRSTKAENWPV